MSWLQLRLDTRPDELEKLEGLMLATGSVAVTMEDNADNDVLEPGVGQTPLWMQTRVTGLYPADADMDAVLARFPAKLMQFANARVEILEDKDWEREWMTHYQPMQFGQSFWVCPSWLAPPDPDATTLLLDPGLAFGTGTHPTTALCLTELAKMTLLKQQVVDYGCGSGILGVAALLLGAVHVLAIDKDPQALVATVDNSERNGIEPASLAVFLPEEVDIKHHTGKADVVIANILAGPLISLSDTLLSLLKPGGSLLLSGLLEKQASELREHYLPRIELTIAGEKDGWVCLLGCMSH
ncbi:MAG: ribosomal protein L11 methyltransferase [Halioglobus sp.]|jgi:ribosomal protein L11 methyltransferase